MARPLRVNERATIASPVNRLRIDMRPPKNSTRGYVIKKKDPFTINGEYERNLKVAGEKSAFHPLTLISRLIGSGFLLASGGLRPRLCTPTDTEPAPNVFCFGYRTRRFGRWGCWCLWTERSVCWAHRLGESTTTFRATKWVHRRRISLSRFAGFSRNSRSRLPVREWLGVIFPMASLPVRRNATTLGE